ncbi:hypothetical protein ABBQ32_012048 [Trebouxia sp. C0010 RCD-2024]
MACRPGTMLLAQNASLPGHMCTSAVTCRSQRVRWAPATVAHKSFMARSRCIDRPNVHARRLCKLAATSVEPLGEGEELGIEEEFSDEADDGRGLSTEQVTQLVHMLCNETDVAEVDLEMGSFQLHVRRRVDAAAAPSSQPAMGSALGGDALGSTSNFELAPEELEKFAKDHSLNGGAAASSSTEDEEDDYTESLVYVSSPKVGILRRGKYFKGKKAGKGNAVNEGDKVKKGQTVAYIEQLGTFVPVEAPQAGEAVEFLIEDGKPVEFREEVVSLAPFFGGHIIGDAKYS